MKEKLVNFEKSVRKCPVCRGDGIKFGQLCNRCGGKGTLTD